MNNTILLHYEEYGGNDYKLTVTPELVVSFIHCHFGYTLSKANLIVGAFEKLDVVCTHGLAFLFDDDEDFYNFAKEKMSKKAAKAFHYEGYLIACTDDNREYEEIIVPSFMEANRLFDTKMAKGFACALILPNSNGGWQSSPVRTHNWKGVKRAFQRKHINSRRNK